MLFSIYYRVRNQYKVNLGGLKFSKQNRKPKSEGDTFPETRCILVWSFTVTDQQLPKVVTTLTLEDWTEFCEH